MKNLTLFLFATILCLQHSFFAQTTDYIFTSSPLSKITFQTSSGSVNIPIGNLPSNYVLTQLNLEMGDNSTQYGGDLSGMTITLRAPNGNEITILSSNSFSTSSNNQKYANIKFRNPNEAKSPKDVSPTSTGYPYSRGYYGSEMSLSSIGTNTTGNLNGTWQLIFTNVPVSTTLASYRRIFSKVELVFSEPAITIDARTTTSPNYKLNNSCINALKINANTTYLSTNIGFTDNQTIAPDHTVGTCQWNTTSTTKSTYNNRISWFYFQAESTTGTISVFDYGGVNMQSIILKVNNTSDLCNTSWILGQCPQYSNASSKFESFNIDYNLSNLTIGATYLVLVDGVTSTTVSNFSILYKTNLQKYTALPVDLTSFDVQVNQHSSNIAWATASERNNDYFTLYRSTDLSEWTEIGTVKGNGTTSVESNYSFVDETPTVGINYYKLKQTDYDGKEEEFDPKSVEIQQRTASLIFPNPTTGTINVVLQQEINVPMQVRLSDMTGRTIMERTIQPTHSSSFRLNEAELKTGTYTLIINNNGIQEQHKIIVL